MRSGIVSLTIAELSVRVYGSDSAGYWPVMEKKSSNIEFLRSSTGVNEWISWGVLAAPGNMIGVLHFVLDLFDCTLFRVMSR